MRACGKTLKAANAIRGRPVSVVGPVNFHMFVVGDRLNQTKDVFILFLVETVEQDCVRGPIIARQFQFGIVHGHVAIVSNAELGSDLQNDFHTFAIAGHRFSLPIWVYERRLLLNGCRAEAKGSTARV
jgi:hypothetical protein